MFGIDIGILEMEEGAIVCARGCACVCARQSSSFEDAKVNATAEEDMALMGRHDWLPIEMTPARESMTPCVRRQGPEEDYN